MRKEEETASRPVLVKFTEEKFKTTMKKQLYKLKDSKYKTISIRDDLCKEDREREKLLRQEAEQKNADNRDNRDGDPTWKYVVRGEPWDRKVVRIKVRKRDE
jgi:hypothetical protein